ncbi:hypothetical protein OIY81_2780 [Cryptosporidium canis]|uniref:Uncharacterized protein n=1 Tax=Cryptosporidium canis TaxID=195482 RepID=A0ABQ8PAB6_9CRYT|nr:hypothetical protein OIY81_2780 [Cryptosporidium canis]KAJ1614352.1 hypothetical protein OJ252_653 [Cryptosporidium canis]
MYTAEADSLRSLVRAQDGSKGFVGHSRPGRDKDKAREFGGADTGDRCKYLAQAVFDGAKGQGGEGAAGGSFAWLL